MVKNKKDFFNIFMLFNLDQTNLLINAQLSNLNLYPKHPQQQQMKQTKDSHFLLYPFNPYSSLNCIVFRFFIYTYIYKIKLMCKMNNKSTIHNIKQSNSKSQKPTLSGTKKMHVIFLAVKNKTCNACNNRTLI